MTPVVSESARRGVGRQGQEEREREREISLRDLPLITSHYGHRSGHSFIWTTAAEEEREELRSRWKIKGYSISVRPEKYDKETDQPRLTKISCFGNGKNNSKCSIFHVSYWSSFISLRIIISSLLKILRATVSALDAE